MPRPDIRYLVGGPGICNGWYWRVPEAFMLWEGPYRYRWQAWMAAQQVPWQSAAIALCVGFTLGGALRIIWENFHV